jgi:hypothetical protein
LPDSILEDRKQAGRFLTFETWTGQAALDAHMTTPGKGVLDVRNSRRTDFPAIRQKKWLLST